MNPDDLMMFLQNAAGSTGSTQVQPIGAPNAGRNQMQPINAAPSGVAFNSPQPPPVPQSQDLTALAQPTGGQVPQLGAPQAPQQQQQRIQGVKGYLSNFLYGVGEAMKAHAGLETDAQRQQREYNNDLNQRKFSLEQANTQAAITQHLAAVQQMQSMVTLPNGIQVPFAIAQKLYPALVTGQSRENVATIQQGQGVPVDETVANLIGKPELAGQSVGKGTLDNINKALTAKGYKTQDLGNEGMWLLDRAGNRIKRIGNSPSVDRAAAFASSRAANTPFETVIPGTNIPTTISNKQALETGAPKVTIAAQGKLGGQYAVFKDSYDLLNKLDADASKVNLNDPATLARLSAGYSALSEPASRGLIGNMAGYIARLPINRSLSNDERQFLIHMGQLKAASTGLRSITGQAGSNEFQQKLDSALAPGPNQASSPQALKQQTQSLREFLNRFSAGQVQVGLNAPNQGTNLQTIGAEQNTGPTADDLLKKYPPKR